MLGSSSSINAFSNLIEVDSLKHLLTNIPTSRTNYYFETKSIQGFKENLHEEIQVILVELQATEENLQRIIKVFLLFLERHEKILNEKDESIFHLTEENERIIMKANYLDNSNDPLTQENINLLERNGQLTEEIEFLDQKCQKYEEMIASLRRELEKSPLTKQKEKIQGFDMNEYFLKNVESLKINFPDFFCKCNGDYEGIKEQNYFLRKKVSELKQENQEITETITHQRERLNVFEYKQQSISYENNRLKQEVAKIQSTRKQIFSDFEEISALKNPGNSLKVRSLSPQREVLVDETLETDQNSRNKYCRSPLLRKKKKGEQLKTIDLMRENVRRKTRTFSIRYNDLFSEIQKSLENNHMINQEDEAINQIFDNFNENNINESQLFQPALNEIKDDQFKPNFSRHSSIKKHHTIRHITNLKEENEEKFAFKRNKEKTKTNLSPNSQKRVCFQGNSAKSNIIENEKIAEETYEKAFLSDKEIKANETKCENFTEKTKKEKQKSSEKIIENKAEAINENLDKKPENFLSETSFKKKGKILTQKNQTVSIGDFFVFIQLIIINIINNNGFSLFGKSKSNDDKRSLLFKLLKTTKQCWFGIIRIWVIFWFFLIILQINFFTESIKQRVRKVWIKK